MSTLVQLLQLLSGALWIIPAGMLLPGVIRTWRGKADAMDAMRGPIFFVCVVQIGFSVRWAIWPHVIPIMGTAELSTWAGLYVLSGLCAIGLIIANRFAERLR